MIKDHLEESKKLITELADEILLNKQNQNSDNRMFAPLFRKTENVILGDYLIELANERLENLKIVVSDKELISKYRSELISFLQKKIKEKL